MPFTPTSPKLFQGYKVESQEWDKVVSLSIDWEGLTEQRLKELATRQSSDSTAATKVPSPIPPPTTSGAVSLSPPTKVKEVVAPPQPTASADLMSLNVSTADNFMSNQAAFHQVPLTGMEGVGPMQSEFSEVAFNAAFPPVPAADTGAPFDPFGEMLQPQSSSSPVPEECESKSSPTSAKLISSDLDSSLHTLVQNLDINGPKKPLKPGGGHQWGSPKTSARTGGANWSPSVPVSNYAPPPQNIPTMPVGVAPTMVSMVNVPVYGYQATVMPAMMSQQPYRMPVWNAATVTPFGMVAQPPMAAPPQMQAQVIYGTPSPQHSAAPTASRPPSNDPFGVL